jgi:hypothetical protein
VWYCFVWMLRFFFRSLSLCTSGWQTCCWKAILEADVKTQKQADGRRFTYFIVGSKTSKQYSRSSACDSGQKRLLRSRVSDIMNSSRSQCSSPESTTSSSKSNVLRVTINLGNHSKHRVTYNPASDRLSLDTAAVSKRKAPIDRDQG